MIDSCYNFCAWACSKFQYDLQLESFLCCRFTVSGRVVGAVGGESCSNKNGGPSNLNVELLSPSGDLISSVSTSSVGIYLFTNILPGMKVCIVHFC